MYHPRSHPKLLYEQARRIVNEHENTRWSREAEKLCEPNWQPHPVDDYNRGRGR